MPPANGLMPHMQLARTASSTAPGHQSAAPAASSTAERAAPPGVRAAAAAPSSSRFWREASGLAAPARAAAVVLHGYTAAMAAAWRSGWRSRSAGGRGEVASCRMQPSTARACGAAKRTTHLRPTTAGAPPPRGRRRLPRAPARSAAFWIDADICWSEARAQSRESSGGPAGSRVGRAPGAGRPATSSEYCQDRSAPAIGVFGR